ncbi:MAG: uracil-DNA glycosylase [SAR202 cluster bacterium]|nr:uracil-DNA glycosylase [SAR202 cluster bacterium]|tara:strand:- start:13993 stop:14601 length:609 start_codon:yes stop_codon:yes gene_type:complete
MFKLKNIEKKINNCTACQIHQFRNKTVPGEGNSTPDIMLIGEAPGKNEDLQGKPFIGAAGKILDQLLSSINLERNQVFITNLMKCRPPSNRDPLDIEISNCSNFLNEQINLLQPKMIVTLGRFSLSKFFPEKLIGRDRGKLFKWKNIFIYPVYHPAAALRNSNMKMKLEQDFLGIPKSLQKIKVNPNTIQNKYKENEQLSFL